MSAMSATNQKIQPQIKWYRLLLVIFDGCMFNMCLLLALWLRFDTGIPAEYYDAFILSIPWMTCILILVAQMMGLYNRIWEYASLDAAGTIIATVTITTIGAALIPLIWEPYTFPRGVLVILWGLSLLAIGGSRFVWRVIRIKLLQKNGTLNNGQKTRVLIYGAGYAGVMLAKQAKQDPDSPYEVVGFIDDDLTFQGMYASGFKVLGTRNDLEAVIKKTKAKEIIIAVACVDGSKMHEVFQNAQALGVRVRTLPRFLELIHGQVSLPQVRDIDVADMLGRSTSCSNLALLNDYINGHTVMITGAGGSIGSEICRQLCRYRPGKVILLGRGENRIHAIYYELKEQYPEISFIPVICNITSRPALEDVLKTYRPQTIFHAAAHKHVFLMECNPVEAVRNNIIGTALLTELADLYGVERFVMISTDKAAEPTSVMGATKAFCERLITHHNSISQNTKYMMVRFGNVLGSAGSVVPIFQSQVKSGRPITVTDPEADRYFMTIAEASFLVLQAGAIGTGGEVFVLDMGDPIKIADIARLVLQLHGQSPDKPGAIQYIGLRAGEKLHETLVNPYEELVPTPVEQVRRVVITHEEPQANLLITDAYEQFIMAVNTCNNQIIYELLEQAVGAQFEFLQCSIKSEVA